MELIAIVSGFIMVVVGAWSNRFKHKDLPWNEHECAIKRAYWLDSLMNDRIFKEQLHMDQRCFDKLCHVLVTRGGLVTTRNVTVLEVVAFFLHTLAHDLKNRTIGAVFTRSGETVSRQCHTVLKVVINIGKFYIKQTRWRMKGRISYQWHKLHLNGTILEMTWHVMNNKHKEPMASTQAVKRGYVSWNKQMDDILSRVLLEEINNKEKGDGDFKPQAYQEVVDDLKKDLGIAINVDHVRNLTKSWKKHYDGSEQHDEAADVIEGEIVSDGRSSSRDPTNSSSHKRKKDSVANAVNNFAESFREYVQSKIKDTPRPTCQEIHTVVSQVFGISRNQIMRAVKSFMNGNLDEFLMLKELAENEKLD
ncbi:Transcription antitermination protein NusB, partial [Bienertia sinuspersici]